MGRGGGLRVLVAGGAGFIGTTFCRRLLERGDQVICVDNLVTGSSANLTSFSAHPGFRFLEADVCQPLDIGDPLDVVANLACPASPADFAPLALEILEVGSRGVANLLGLARQHGACFLQTSTSEVYGEPLVHPQPESYWGNVNPIGPRSVYDEAKRFGEALTMAYHRQHGVDTRIVRIFNTYGPGMRSDDGRVISNFVVQALEGRPLTVYGDGRQTRSFCFVEDQVLGQLALLASDYSGPVNIGSDDERTMLELARIIIELTGSKSEVTFAPRPVDDPTQRCPDLGLARRELGWEPTTALADGLDRTISWFSSRLGAGA
ncbi:MAG: UDP-glucuronic acid decarboxylase family protein [Acidimicrobiales bacterium]